MRNTLNIRQIMAAMVIALLAWPHDSDARHHRPIPPTLGSARQLGAQADNGASNRQASPWTPLNNQPNFMPFGASTPMLLTDGTVLVQDTCATDWWRLTPDKFGSYVNGTWTRAASLPDRLCPLQQFLRRAAGRPPHHRGR